MYDNFDYIFSVGDTLADVARRYEITGDAIVRETCLLTGPEYAWASASGYVNPGDGDHAAIPIPTQQNNLPGLSEWRPCLVADVIALNDPGASFAVGPPLATLVSNLNASNLPIGALVPGMTAERIWNYYGNAQLRHDSIVASVSAGTGAPSDAASAPVLATATILLPVVPPRHTSTPAAPSPTSAPATSATIDLGPDPFDDLMLQLHMIEAALDDLDRTRAQALSYATLTQTLCCDFNDLLKSMKAMSDHLHAAAAMAKMTDQGQPLRDDAIAKLDRLVARSTGCLIMTGTNPAKVPALTVNAQAFPASNSIIGAYCPEKVTYLSGQMIVLNGLVSDPPMMNLLVTLIPEQYDRPVRARNGLRSVAIDYVCALAARVAIALANSPNAGDWESLGPLVTLSPPKHAGASCQTLLEYAYGCTQGFENGQILTSPAPWECFSVVATLYMGAALPRIGTERTETLSNFLTDIAKDAIGNIRPILNKFFDKTVLPSADELKERIDKRLVELGVTDARIPTYGTATKVSVGLIEWMKLSDYQAARFVLAVDKPFSAPESPFFQNIPPAVRGFFSTWSTIQAVAAVVAPDPSKPHQQTNVDADFVNTVVTAANTGLGFVGSIPKNANAVLKIFGKDALFTIGEADLLLAMCGRATWCLTVALAAYDSLKDLETSRDVWSEVGDTLVLESVIFLALGGVGGPVCVTIGVASFALGTLARNRPLLIDLWKGRTVLMFEAIVKSGSVHVDFCKRMGFASDLDAFAAAFRLIDFTAGGATLSDMAGSSSSLGGP